MSWPLKVRTSVFLLKMLKLYFRSKKFLDRKNMCPGLVDQKINGTSRVNYRRLSHLFVFSAWNGPSKAQNSRFCNNKKSGKKIHAITVSCHASGPPKRPITKLLGVKMKLESNENCIGLKFGPLLIIGANFSPIGQL